MISEKTVDSVFALARIEEVVEDYVQLRRAGSNFTGLCPFHDEKTPSFMVSPGKNIYKCFGCGQGGNPVNFIMEHEKLSFPESIRLLASRYHIPVEETAVSEEYQKEKELVESFYIINEFAQAYFVKNLLHTEEGKSIGLSYFKERGFIDKTIETFGLGYATHDRTELYKKAIKAQYKEEFLFGVGLVSERKYDFFNQRVMFPIHNLNGKVIGFAGRILTADKKAPKYINSKESEIYNKRKLLYGMYQAKGEIRKKDACFLVEGYTDVISMHQAGVENVVASSGTSLTPGQIKLIKRFTENLIMLFDGDKAGIKAAMRGIDIALEHDMNVKVVILPDNADPDSFINEKGYDGFTQFVEQHATDFIHFKTELFIKEGANDPVKRAEFIGDIVNSIAKIQNTIKRALYIQQCSESLNISEKIIIGEINKVLQKDLKQKSMERSRADRLAESKDPRQETDASDQPSISTYVGKDSDVYQERDLLRVFVNYGGNYHRIEKTSVAEYIYDKIKDEFQLFENKDYAHLISIAMDYISKNKKETPTSKVKEEQNSEDPLFGDIETIEEEEAKYVEVISSKFYTQHPDDKVRKMAIDLLTEKYSYANWEERGIELQTQKNPEDNYVRDSYQAIVQFKIRKVKVTLKAIMDRVKIAREEDNKEQLVALLEAYQQSVTYRNNLSKELNTIIISS